MGSIVKYLVIQTQSREGCDYTIGCGTRADIIEAESLEIAQQMVLFPNGVSEKAVIFDDGDGDYIKSIRIVAEGDWYEIDVEGLRRIKAAEDAKAKTAVVDAERAEYDRLKRKFG